VPGDLGALQQRRWWLGDIDLTTYETKQTLVLNEWMGQGMMWSANINFGPEVSRMEVKG